MPRIRSIKPEWLDDERLGVLSDTARMVSIALITLADDHGNGRAHTMFLVSRIWAYSEDPGEASRRLAASLGELEQAGFVTLYTVENQRYFSVNNWSKHQRISNAGKPLVPGPAEVHGSVAATRGDSRPETETETETETERECARKAPDSTPVLLERAHEREYFRRRAVAPTKSQGYRRCLAAASVWCETQAASEGAPVAGVVDRLVRGLFASANPKIQGDWGMRFLGQDCAEFYATAAVTRPKLHPKIAEQRAAAAAGGAS